MSPSDSPTGRRDTPRPAAQNLHPRTDEVRRVRAAFTADVPPVAVDFASVERRVLATMESGHVAI